MIDVTKETLLTFSQAGQLAKVTARTIRNWTARGLESVSLGGSRRTSAEALNRFMERIDYSANPSPLVDCDSERMELMERHGL